MLICEGPKRIPIKMFFLKIILIFLKSFKKFLSSENNVLSTH